MTTKQMDLFRKPFRWLLALSPVFIATALGLQFLDSPLSSLRGSDSASYVLLAKAIASGHGYSDMNIPGYPPHTQYPPLLPLLLSPVFFFLGYNFIAMKLLTLVFGAASVYMAGMVFDGKGGYTGAFIALLLATNSYFLFYTTEIASEVPYLFFSLLSLRLLITCKDSRALPVTIWAAYLTRMAGVAVYAASIAAMLFGPDEDGRRERLRRALKFAIIGIAPFVIWTIRNRFYGKGTSTYGSIFLQADYYARDKGLIGIRSLSARVIENLGYYGEALPRGVFTGGLFEAHSYMAPALYAAVLIVFAAGFLRELFSRRGAREFYLLFYLTVIIVWPVYGIGDARRYVLPVLPFIYFYFITGAGFLTGLLASRPDTPAVSVRRALPVFLVLMALNLAGLGGLIWPPEAARNIIKASRYIAAEGGKRAEEATPENIGAGYFTGSSPCFSRYIISAFGLKGVTAPADVVMTRKPELVSLITGGHALRYPFTKDYAEMERFMEENRVGYLLIDGCYPENTLYLTPFVSARRDSFSVLMDDSKGAVLLKRIR